MNFLPRLDLPDVTLIAVTSVNLLATVRSLQHSMSKARFATCKLLTHCVDISRCPGIEIHKINEIKSSHDYSYFILNELFDYITTTHCLIVQWDSQIINTEAWSNSFLDFDYIGASWPQFTDGRNVGNGGFSLRSRRLLELCRKPGFAAQHPEDIAICRTNRKFLEQCGIKYADSLVADCFSTERTGDLRNSFGYHGIWNMPDALGHDEFWRFYSVLDERTSLHHDFWPLLRLVIGGPGGLGRASTMIRDRLLTKRNSRTPS